VRGYYAGTAGHVSSETVKNYIQRHEGGRVVTTLTKTLELKLVEPNAHKRRKLRETREAYQQALHDAFDAGCTTQTEANDVVVNYKLSGYAKNALKKYVPQLTTTYNAGELHDAHPVRFTNEGLRLDHKPENAIEWYVKIPHHEDYHLWMPAQPNPEQRDWLEALNAGDATMGESRLFERDGTWYLHVTATRDAEGGSEVSDEERTPIGVDIGEASLVTVCHRDDHGCPTAPELWADEGRPFVGSARPTSPPRGDFRHAVANVSRSPSVTTCGTR